MSGEEIFKKLSESRTPKLFARAGIGVLILVALWASCLKLEIGFDRLVSGTFRFLSLIVQFFPPNPGEWLGDFSYALLETISIALWGTFLGVVGALPLSFLGASNFNRNDALRMIVRRFFDVIRGIDGFIWALVYIHVVGMGPFAGILAIATVDTAVLGKLFSEAIEHVDRNEIDGVKSTGAGWLEILRYGYLSQLQPILLGNALYFFESNVRAASALGILGAGGIGMQMMDRIRIMNWPQVGFLVIMTLVTIGAIDLVSRTIRETVIGTRRASSVLLQ
jgi:phosphonate transport system permease protein